MICPYNQIFAYNENTNVLDDENPDFIRKHINVTIWKNMKCLKEGCAVWREGKCCYNSKME